MTARLRAFNVRLRDLAGHRGRLLEERSFEAAAIAFAEEWPPLDQSSADVAVIVCDQLSGEERCFRIDLATSEASPCSDADL